MRSTTIALLFAVIPAVSFVILYLWEYRHVKSTPESRHLIGFTAILAVILLEELVRRTSLRDIIDTATHRTFVAVTVAFAGVYLWQRLYLLLKYQIVPRHKRHRTRQKVSP